MASSVTPTSTTRDCPATEHSGARWIPVPRSRINRFWIEYFNPREALNKSVRGECFPFAPSIHRATRGTGGTTDMTTSHLTNPAKDAGQVIGYSHSTRLPNNSSQVAGYQDERKMYRTIINWDLFGTSLDSYSSSTASRPDHFARGFKV